MKPHTYCHMIQFRGSAHPQGRYLLQILEVGSNGKPQYRAQWKFETLRQVREFLQKYFPDSQALPPVESQPAFTFDRVLAIAGL